MRSTPGPAARAAATLKPRGAYPHRTHARLLERRHWGCESFPAMLDASRYDRIGSARQALAADLAAERRQSAVLRRENKHLKAQLEAANRHLTTCRAHRTRSRGAPRAD